MGVEMRNEDEDFYTGGPMNGGGYVHVLKLGPHQCILMYRNIYKSYNETPTTSKRGSIMSPKTAKKMLKVGLMVGSALIYGALHKVEKNLGEKIDERYADDIEETQDTED